MRIFLSYTLEPLAFAIYCGVFGFYILKVDKRFRYVALFVYYLLATALMMRVAAEATVEISNTHIYNLLNLATGLGISTFFYSLLTTRLKKTIAMVLGIVTMLNYMINIKEPYLDSLGLVIVSTGIVILIFLYLNQILNHVTEEPLSLNFDFWYVCVQLVYHLGSFAIFLSYNYFTHVFFLAAGNSKEIRLILAYLWVVHNVLLFLGALIICFATIWIFRRKLPSS